MPITPVAFAALDALTEHVFARTEIAHLYERVKRSAARTKVPSHG
ncbi:MULTISPECIES: hypothetical protein [unclassified Alistipes]|nr:MULTISPECIES: hypothetical protein [unclassified Alistipes]